MKRLLALALLLASCAAPPAARLQAVGGVGHIYVMSDQNAHPFQPGATWGDDSNDCATKLTPCVTLGAAVAKAEASGLDDVAWQIHMGGWSAPGSAGTANDPWDGYATEPRAYLMPVVPLHSNRATRNTFSYIGPRKMFVTAPAPVGYQYATQVGAGRVLLRFASHQLAYGSSGLFLRFTEGAGGRELAFPHVVSEATPAGLVIDSNGIAASDWDWYVANMAGTFEVCEPAAQIVGSFTEQSYPVIVRGHLPPDVGDGIDDGVATDTNATPAFARVLLFRPRFVWTGVLHLDSVWTDIEARYFGGALRGHSVTAAPNGIVVYQGEARTLGNDSGHDAQHERRGWARVPYPYGGPIPPDADPYIQFNGPIDMTVSGGLIYVGGRAEAQGPAYLAVHHGLSVWCDCDAVPVDVAGPAAFLDIRDGASLFVGPPDASIWAKEGARVRLDMDRATLGTVRAGRTAAVTPTSAMWLTGDDGSFIWDRGAELLGW